MNNLKAYIKNTFLGNIFLRSRTFFRSRKYYNKYTRLVTSRSSLKDIEVISVEFCAICNLKCRYCFLEKGTRPSFLDLDIYKKLLREVCGNKEYCIRIMEWPISGCFFLHPRCKEIIAITKDYKQRYSYFRPWIILNDNMMLFNKDNVDFVLKQGVVDQIICSIDGVDKETFEYMRPNACFDTVIENTDYLLRKNKKDGSKVMIQINNGRDEKCAGRKISPTLKELFGRVDVVTNWEPLDWNQSFHKDHPQFTPYPRFCSFVFESVSLSTSGAITKCCMDLKETTKYGDFNKYTLRSIWFSEKRREFLRAMYEGERHSIPGCDTCSINYVSQNKLDRK